jgi:Tol biopolymer transport system component
MKSKNLLIGLVCLLIVVVVLSISTKTQKTVKQAKSETILIETWGGGEWSSEGTAEVALGHPPDTIRGYEIIEIGQGRSPRFSPDSKKIAFLSGGWLCVRNSDGSGVIDKITPMRALDFQWMSDSSIIYWNQERYGTSKFTRSVKIVSLKGEEKPVAVGVDEKIARLEPPIFLPDGTIGYHKHSLLDKTSSFVVIKQGSLPPDSALKQLVPKIKFETSSVMYGDIWLVSIDGSYKRWVTFNKRFGFPEMSPDRKKIIATKIPGKDPFEGGGPFIIDLKGHETNLSDPDLKIPVKDTLGNSDRKWIYSSGALFAKFSPDGSKVVYMYEAMDTALEDIVASDLVIKNVDGTGRFQIETPDVMEEFPVWSPDGKMIACQTYNTNKIYVFRLK